jgi:hypothetical protein
LRAARRLWYARAEDVTGTASERLRIVGRQLELAALEEFVRRDGAPRALVLMDIRISFAVLVALAAAVLPLAAYAGPAEPGVPAALAVPDGNKLFLVGHAVGVRIYGCDASAAGYRWTLRGPRARG